MGKVFHTQGLTHVSPTDLVVELLGTSLTTGKIYIGYILLENFRSRRYGIRKLGGIFGNLRPDNDGANGKKKKKKRKKKKLGKEDTILEENENGGVTNDNTAGQPTANGELGPDIEITAETEKTVMDGIGLIASAVDRRSSFLQSRQQPNYLQTYASSRVPDGGPYVNDAYTSDEYFYDAHQDVHPHQFSHDSGFLVEDYDHDVVVHHVEVEDVQYDGNGQVHHVDYLQPNWPSRAASEPAIGTRLTHVHSLEEDYQDAVEDLHDLVDAESLNRSQLHLERINEQQQQMKMQRQGRASTSGSSAAKQSSGYDSSQQHADVRRRTVERPITRESTEFAFAQKPYHRETPSTIHSTRPRQRKHAAYPTYSPRENSYEMQTFEQPYYSNQAYVVDDEPTQHGYYQEVPSTRVSSVRPDYGRHLQPTDRSHYQPPSHQSQQQNQQQVDQERREQQFIAQHNRHKQLMEQQRRQDQLHSDYRHQFANVVVEATAPRPQPIYATPVPFATVPMTPLNLSSSRVSTRPQQIAESQMATPNESSSYHPTGVKRPSSSSTSGSSMTSSSTDSRTRRSSQYQGSSLRSPSIQQVVNNSLDPALRRVAPHMRLAMSQNKPIVNARRKPTVAEIERKISRQKMIDSMAPKESKFNLRTIVTQGLVSAEENIAPHLRMAQQSWKRALPQVANQQREETDEDESDSSTTDHERM